MSDIVSDASPILTYARAGELGLLRSMAPALVIPPAVRDEIVTRGAGRPGAAEVAADDWIRTRPLADPAAVRGMSAFLDEGEREAIALAQELGSRLLIDERAGRKEAARLGIPTLSTLSVLRAAKLTGAVPAARPVLDNLLQAGFRLSQRLHQEFLRDLGE